MALLTHIDQQKTMLEWMKSYFLKADGNAVSATKATQDGNGAVIADTYLPLAGGTVTGPLKITDSDDPDGVVYKIRAMASDADADWRGLQLSLDYNPEESRPEDVGAFMRIFSKDSAICTGYFQIVTGGSDDAGNHYLSGRPNGTLTWGNDTIGHKEVERVVSKSIGKSGYIKFASGMIIQWVNSINYAVMETFTWPTAWSTSTSWTAIAVQPDCSVALSSSSTSAEVGGVIGSTFSIIAIGY